MVSQKRSVRIKNLSLAGFWYPKLIAISLLIIASPLSAQNWDINTLKKFNPADPHSQVLRGVTNSTYIISAAAPLAVLVTGFVNDDAVLKRKSYVMIAGTIIQVGASTVLKEIVGRQRPAEKYPFDVFPYEDKYGKSFPSGHTGFAFATATSLTLQFPKWYVAVPAFMWAGAVGYSRLYLGVHYPSDVAGGAVLGAGSALLAHWLNKKLFSQTRQVVLVRL